MIHTVRDSVRGRSIIGTIVWDWHCHPDPTKFTCKFFIYNHKSGPIAFGVNVDTSRIIMLM